MQYIEYLKYVKYCIYCTHVIYILELCTMYYTWLLVSSLLRPVCSTRVGRLLETYSKTSYISHFKDSLFKISLYAFFVRLYKFAQNAYFFFREQYKLYQRLCNLIDIFCLFSEQKIDQFGLFFEMVNSSKL